MNSAVLWAQHERRQGNISIAQFAQVYIGSRNHPEDVPNHIIKTGEKIKVDTRTGKYMERA